MEKQCVRCGRAGHDSDECPWPLFKILFIKRKRVWMT